ncbi:MAG: sensor histidine kinase [Eubacterium sp.]
MKTKGEILGAYIKDHLKTVLVFLLFMVLLFCVYGLYGLPWGPAVYGAILTAGVALVVSVWGFYSYLKSVKVLEDLKNQTVLHLEHFKKPTTLPEAYYQALLKKCEKDRSAQEEKARVQLEAATRYYTLWSHQIKTPLAAMDLLTQEEKPDLEAFRQELFRASQYVEMALNYQRLRSESSDLVFKKQRLSTLAKQAVKKTAPLFIYHKIGIHLDLGHSQVVTDEKWMVFILEQLLSNAVKYTQEGTVKIYELAGTLGGLVIEDTGIGILEEDLPRIFEWGYTGFNGRKTKNSTGIGLSLCRQAAEMLGYKIEIKSHVGIGTKVFISPVLTSV